MTSETMNKVCSNIEQKGVAQLLQIEEVWLNFLERVVLFNHHIHKKLLFF